MPRSVPHEFDGALSDMQLRVWERRSDGSFHAIVEGRFVYQCESSIEHPLDVHSRWDVPAANAPWHGLARRARDRDSDAARQLAQRMTDEAIEAEWTDPCATG